MVQARTVADGSPVGAFTDSGDNLTLSSCTPAEVYIALSVTRLYNFYLHSLL